MCSPPRGTGDYDGLLTSVFQYFTDKYKTKCRQKTSIFSEKGVSLVDEQEFAQSYAQRQAGWCSIRTASSTPSLGLDSRFILSNQKPEGHVVHVSTLVSNALILLELQDNYYMKIRYYLESQKVQQCTRLVS